MNVRIACSICLVLAAGCSGLNKRPYPAQDRFAILAPLPEPASASAGRSDSPIVRIERLEIPRPYGDLPFVYRVDDLKFETDYYNQFVAMPDRMLTAELVRCLAATGQLTPVGPTSQVDTPLRLEGTITGLYGDLRDPAKPAAVLTARFALLREDSLATQPIGQWSIEIIEPLPDAKPESLAAGYGRAVSRLASELATKLAEPR